MKKLLFALLLLLGFGSVALADDMPIPEGVVLQANGTKPADLKRAVILASNMHEVLTKTKFEIVVYGPGVKMLTEFSDEVPLIQKAQSEGIEIIACGRSLDTEHVKASDMAPGVKVVPYGAVWLVQREKQGWQYMKP